MSCHINKAAGTPISCVDALAKFGYERCQSLIEACMAEAGDDGCDCVWAGCLGGLQSDDTIDGVD